MSARQLISKRDPVMDGLPGSILRWAGATLIFLIGGAHVLISGEHFLAAPYLGVLFLANFTASIAAAFALYWSPNIWGWLLGAAISGGALTGFVVSRAIGLPGFEEEVGRWFNIAALLTVMMEGAFLSLFLLAVTPWGRNLLRVQQERIEQERVAGQKQPLEQPLLGAPLKAPGLLEKEMANIRSRMAPDLVDLRRHVEPQGMKEQAKRSLREGIRSVFRRG